MAPIMHARALVHHLSTRGSCVKVLSVCPLWVGVQMTKKNVGFFAFPVYSIGLSSTVNAMFAEIGVHQIRILYSTSICHFIQPFDPYCMPKWI